MENKTYYTTLAIIYFGFCAVLWNIGYWSVFDLNIFSYYGLIDILKDFTYPFLIHSGVPILIYLVLISVDFTNSFKDTDTVLLLRSKPKYYRKIAQYKYILTAVAIILFVTATYLDFNYKYFILPFVAALVSSVVFLWNRFLMNLIPYPYIRFLTILIFVYIPTSTFCEARYMGLYTKAHPKNLHIKIQMNNATYASNANDGITYSGGDFLGSTSDKVFFTDSTSSRIIIVNIKDVFSVIFEKEAIKPETEKIQ